jgi:pimeloyl-ACP methyl ester carboxylesterase
MKIDDIDVHSDSRFAAVDGMRIHYKRSGTGPTVVLLHGSASSLYGVEAVAQRLRGSFDVIRLDLPRLPGRHLCRSALSLLGRHRRREMRGGR